MKTVPLKSIFNISYGNKFDLNKMKLADFKDDDSIAFVSRTAKNLGVSAYVKKHKDIEPYQSELITVALGGAMLSTNIQQKNFYTAQNIMVLEPKHELSFNEKLYYCICIEKNKKYYSTFGREANRTLKELKIPELVPEWVLNLSDFNLTYDINPIDNSSLIFNTTNWKWFLYKDIFELKKGKRLTKANMYKGKTPFIAAIDKNNGYRQYIGQEPIHKENTITVNYNGSVAEAFYQPIPFWATDDINVLYPKFELNKYIGMFLIAIIRKEKYRFNYGRKWHLERMNESKIKLPINNEEKPDWDFMENYIKSLPYSKYI